MKFQEKNLFFTCFPTLSQSYNWKISFWCLLHKKKSYMLQSFNTIVVKILLSVPIICVSFAYHKGESGRTFNKYTQTAVPIETSPGWGKSEVFSWSKVQPEMPNGKNMEGILTGNGLYESGEGDFRTQI